MKNLFSSSQKILGTNDATLNPSGEGKWALDSSPIVGLFPLGGPNLVPISSKKNVITLTNASLFKEGDRILFVLGAHRGVELIVTEVVGNTISTHADIGSISPADEFEHYRPKSLSVTSDGNCGS